MASIKVVYHVDGLYLRYTVDRISKYKKIVSLSRDKWKNGKVTGAGKLASEINMLILSAEQDANTRLYLLKREKKTITHQVLMQESANNSMMILECIRNHINKMDAQHRHKASRKYTNLFDKIALFGDIEVKNISLSYMADFQSYLLSLEAIKSKETVKRYIKMLKSCVRYEKGLDPIVLSFTPVSGYVSKVKLDKDEFEKIEALQDDRYNRSCELFQALVYAWGCRVGDMLTMQHSNIHGRSLIYIERKTKKKKTVEINTKMQELIDKYQGRSKWYIFPVLKVAPWSDPIIIDAKIEAATATINKHLKVIAAMCGINKNLSTHVARHTFASWGIQKGIPSEILRQLLNHTKFSTTEQYLKDLKRDDDLNNAAGQIFE